MSVDASTIASRAVRQRIAVVGNEDWWAVLIGLAIVLIAIADWLSGAGLLKQLAVSPTSIKWTSVSEIPLHYAKLWPNYLAQFAFLALIFGGAGRLMGRSFSQFCASFAVLYALYLGVSTIAGWKDAGQYNLEASFLALLAGLAISNVIRLPEWLKASLRVEFFVKTGVVLLGATFPLSIIAAAGPIALIQATIVSLVTCLVIYGVATRWFGLSPRFAAVLGTGGAVCGVSASIAVAASVGARKDEVCASVSLVVIFALIMAFLLPALSSMLVLPAGVAGAWIGTSEFADAAGYAAANLYGRMVGNEEAALRAFTMTKVIGRDVWIGLWSLIWAAVATRVWDRKGEGAASGWSEVWRRFPKFVIGFFLASFILTMLLNGADAAATKAIRADVVGTVGGLRAVAFTLCFLSIGLTTRFADLDAFTWRALLAFGIGVVVNVALGYFLSAHVFAAYWLAL